MKSVIVSIVTLATLLSCQSNAKREASTEVNKSVEQITVWDKSYGGADKSYDSELLRLREEVAPKFEKLEFTDEVTGRTMKYNLYIPKDYDLGRSFPLVQFIADASTVGKGIEAPLKQGYGGIVWATDESQAEHPCFVLVPSFEGPERAVNDQWEITQEVEISYRLLMSIISKYDVDKGRVYTTGQSMGGMISFFLNSQYPDLFAASIFVGSQWDINVLQPLAKSKFIYIVSSGDEKASNGMSQVGEMLTKSGVKYGAVDFSARLPQLEQEAKVQDMLKEGNRINFISFTKGTVIPEGSLEMKGAPEHMYSFDYAYKLKSVRDWLFSQWRD
ncbi:MAG: alpha/beta hydrolase-fold protein [Bacteroidales bacterium]